MSSQIGHPHNTSPWMINDEAGPSKDRETTTTTTSTPVIKKEAERSPTEESMPVDKTKRTQSCDSCRKRKIKCIQVPKEERKAEFASLRRCVACTAIGVDCTYIYVPKRPGPQSSRSLKQARTDSTATSSTIVDDSPAASKGQFIEDKSLGNLQNTVDLWSNSPSSYPSFADTSPEDLSVLSDLATSTFPMQWTPTVDHLPSPSFTITSPSMANFPASATFALDQQSQNLPRCLDDIASRHLFMHIMAIYVEHLYPLIPIVHKPTLEGFLAVRRDDTDKEFLAFVLSLSAYTLLEAPSSIIPITQLYSNQLREVCHTTSRRLQRKTYESPKMIDICTLYLDHLYLGGTNFINSANAVLAQAISLGYSLGLHNEEEASKSVVSTTTTQRSEVRPPTPASTIERELRRRVYYLLYNSDKSIALLQHRPMLLRDDFSYRISLPRKLDEDTTIGDKAAPQFIADVQGFAIVTRLYRLLSEILESRKGVERRPPSHQKELQEHKLYIRAMLNKVKSTLEGVSKSTGSAPRSNFNMLLSFAGSHFEAGASNGLDPILTVQANIAITTTMIRFALAEYQDLCLRTPSVPSQTSLLSSINVAPASNTPSVIERIDVEVAAAELSETLQSIPMECLIANGYSFVAKLLYITSRLFKNLLAGTSNYQHLSKLIDILTRLTLSRNGHETASTTNSASTVPVPHLDLSNWSTPSSSSVHTDQFRDLI